MEQAEVPPQRAVCDPCPNEDAVASIWSTLCNGFSAGKHWLLLLLQSLQNVRTTPLAHSLATYRQMVNWDEACIRCIAIHPTSRHQALITSEDIVHLFVNWVDPAAQLQAPEQVDLYCVAYRPCTNRELAVGCAAGIYIWRNVSSQLWGKRLLSHKAHIHVTSVQWNQPGTTLVSVAMGSRQIIVWNTDSAQTIRMLSASISFLLYSPDFQLLFGASSDAGADVCYVERRCWQLEHILAERPIQTAAWTAGSTYLLFVQKDDTHLYSITRYADLGVFLKPQLFWTFELVADLHEIFVLGKQKHHGQAQAIAVDPLNIYLAVIYKRQPFVLLCKLSMKKHAKLRIIPWEYIHCDDEQARGQCAYATCMCFGHAKENGRRRTLTIGWNTGYYQVEWLKTDNYKRCI
ncbi:aladin-like [Drosophila obscura]|uniref:aladin-like n=1 Tax=Drosophila obscura TaxID=7282 RepID=UPI001BB25AB4|nr:aladin-like [Drosophila obscura]